MKKLFNDFFNIHLGEYQGILMLLALVMMLKYALFYVQQLSISKANNWVLIEHPPVGDTPTRYLMNQQWKNKKILTTPKKWSNQFSKRSSTSKKIIELNTTDTLELLIVKGIGAYRSRAIIKYRNLLGGYYSIDQLKEVRGLDSSSIAAAKLQCTVNSAYIVKFPIDTFLFRENFWHPYWDYKKKRLLQNYRLQRGRALLKSELYQMKFLDSGWINKVLPYIRDD